MLDEPDADIANVINNFLIEAQALRASQQSLSAKVELQSTALAGLADQTQKTRSILLHIAKAGVSVHLDAHVQHIEKIGGDVAQSITTASRRAEQALTAKLRDAETLKANGLILTLVVAVFSGVMSALAMAACIYGLPVMFSLLAHGGRS